MKIVHGGSFTGVPATEMNAGDIAKVIEDPSCFVLMSDEGNVIDLDGGYQYGDLEDLRVRILKPGETITLIVE